jgi:hydrogenase maturation factor HypF (carbamoyltransferase family)
MQKQIIRLVEKVLVNIIPKHQTCRIEESKREFKREIEKKRILADFEKVQMDNNPLSIEVKEQWEQIPPDMSVCKACKETIYTNQYILSFVLNSEKIEPTNRIVLCVACYYKKDD